MLIIPDMESTSKGKDQREQGKGKGENPYDEDATKGEAPTAEAPKPRSKANGVARGLPIESLDI